MGTHRRQQEIDDEAHTTAADAEDQAIAELARSGSVTAPAAASPAATPRRVELDITPEESREITTSALDDGGDFGDGEQYAPIPGSSTSDYGAQGMREMQHAIDTRANEPASALAQPWGARGNDEVFGFASDGDPELPGRFGEDRDAEIYGVATDDDPVLPGRSAYGARALAQPQGIREPGNIEPDADADDATTDRPRLDEGLPTEADIASARPNFGQRLANALRAYAHRPTVDYEARGDRLQQQRTQGIERRQAAKGAARTAESTAARQATLDARAERQLDQADRRLDQQAELNASLMGQRTAQTEHLVTADEIARGTREAREAVDSDVSSGARRAWDAGVQRLPESMRSRLESVISPGDLPTMTAAQLEAPLRMLERISVGARGSGGSGGGGGTTEALTQLLVDRHVAETPQEAQQVIAAMGMRGARSAAGAALTPAARRASSGAEGVEILPGVTARLADQIEARNIRNGFASARTQYASLGAVEQIAQRFGASGPISPEAAGELGGPLSRLRAMVATLQNTGVINPSEAPTIEAMLPDPRSVSQMTFDTLQGRLRSFRTELDSQVESQLATRGVDEAGIRTALSQLHGAIGAPARRAARADATSSAPSEGAPRRGRVRLPDGREVPVRDVDEAVRRGAVAL